MVPVNDSSEYTIISTLLELTCPDLEALERLRTVVLRTIVATRTELSVAEQDVYRYRGNLARWEDTLAMLDDYARSKAPPAEEPT